jgi:hypothetical protein
MINRENWKLYKGYLKYRLEIDRLVPGSLVLERTCMIILLEWLDDKSVWQAPKISPNFIDYLKNRNKEGYSTSYSR